MVTGAVAGAGLTGVCEDGGGCRTNATAAQVAAAGLVSGVIGGIVGAAVGTLVPSWTPAYVRGENPPR